MACSGPRSVVRTTTDHLTIPIRPPPTDKLPVGPCLSGDAESPPAFLLPLSLSQLKAGEIIQRVHSDASSLLCSIEGLLQPRAPTAAGRRVAVPKTVLGNPALVTAQRLSRGISGDVGELIALSRREATLAVRDAEQFRRMRHHRRVIEKRCRAAAAAAQHKHQQPHQQHPDTDGLVQLVCHSCSTRRTPQWRSGPAGPCTLCNVCGLVHALRMRKRGRASRSKKASALCYSS
ncbi:hypothetical protein LX36DRAFT_660004 [Colletotrichum falcatum]|nr:hypothetical protein LX36DRAFT_660004 [Colletotrichum falcatum]